MFRDCHAIHPEDSVTTGPILHLFGWDKKFVLPFRQLIHTNFAADQHQFVLYGDIEPDLLAASADTLVYPKLLTNFWAMSRIMHQAEKVILHGLFSNHLLYILAMQPWLLAKCYWVIWGGDLYCRVVEPYDWRWRKNEIIRRFVIKRLGHFLTYVPGDYELVRKWYGASGTYHECLMYPSNVFDELPVARKRTSTINIQIGNSADPGNRHFEIFEKLLPFRDGDIAIYAPLSYGDRSYAQSVIAEGINLFGKKFHAKTEVVTVEEYREFLNKMDIAVFNHQRQQGMGNIITLLGLGKKIFLQRDITSWSVFKRYGLIVFDIQCFDLSTLSDKEALYNSRIVAQHFSKSVLIRQWSDILR